MCYRNSSRVKRRERSPTLHLTTKAQTYRNKACTPGLTRSQRSQEAWISKFFLDEYDRFHTVGNGMYMKNKRKDSNVNNEDPIVFETYREDQMTQ
jgi:hypothetical protein